MTEDEKWDAYFIEGTDVLKNNLGISNKKELEQKAADITFEKLIELYQNPIEGSFDKKHLCEVHKYLFEDIYPFAGEYRNVYFMKGNSYFSGVDDIDWKLEYVLKEMNEQIREINTQDECATFLAGYYTDLISIHPFREGNGRTIREFLREFIEAKTKDFELNWANVDKEKLLSGIRNSFFSRSELTMEFMKALEYKETKIK